MSQLTNLELVVLFNIVHSEFQDSDEIGSIINYPIWSFSATNEQKDLAGALGSLVKKGLAGTQKEEGQDAVCWLTKAGALGVGLVESTAAVFPANLKSSITYFRSGKQEKEQFIGLPNRVYCAEGFPELANAEQLYLSRLTENGTGLIPLKNEGGKDVFYRNPSCYGKNFCTQTGVWHT